MALAAETREHERGEKVRVDCTPVAANVHFPSDSSLIWDSIRVLTRLGRKAREFGIGFPDRRRVAKQKQQKIYWARRKVQRVPVYRVDRGPEGPHFQRLEGTTLLSCV